MNCDMQVDVAAYHDVPGYEWRVPGVGLICDSLLVGVMRNSVNRTSYYAGFKWEPTRFGDARLGYAFGAITGYGKPRVFGALVASKPITKDLTAHIAIFPSTELNPLTVQFSVSFPLP